MTSEARIDVDGVTVLFPLYHGSARSLKKMVVAAASGRLAKDQQHRIVVQALREEVFAPSRGDISILDTVVPEAVAYREAVTQGVPVHRWRPARPVAPDAHPRVTMLALVRELLPHVQTERFRSDLN